MARSDLLKFWKMLSDSKFIGRPSQLTEDAVREMAVTLGLIDPEIEAVVRGLCEVQKLVGLKNPERPC